MNSSLSIQHREVFEVARQGAGSAAVAGSKPDSSPDAEGAQAVSKAIR